MVVVPTQSMNIIDEQSMTTQRIFGFAAAAMLRSSELRSSSVAAAAAAVSASGSLSYQHIHT